MNDKLKSLLQKLGLSIQQIADFENTEALEKISVDTLYKATVDNIGESLKNTASFVDPIKAAARGEFMGSKERKMMSLYGVTQAEYDALPKATKFDSLQQLCYDKIKAAPGGDDDSKAEIAKLQDVVKAGKAEIERFNTVEIPNIKAQVTTKLTEINTNQALRKTLGKALGEKHQLIVEADFAQRAVEGELREMYDLKLMPDNSLQVLQKGTDLEVFVDNVKVTAEGAYLSRLQHHKLLKESNGGAGGGGGGGGGRKTTDIKDTDKYETPGMKKARERADADKKRREEKP